MRHLKRMLCLAAACSLLACSDDNGTVIDDTGIDDTGTDGLILPDGSLPDLSDPDRGAPEGGAPDGSADQGIDMESNPCLGCQANEVCVQLFDGTCTTGPPSCVTVSATCLANKGTPGTACDPQCEPEYCGSPYQCQNQVPCGNEKGLVDIYCYGP